MASDNKRTRRKRVKVPRLWLLRTLFWSGLLLLACAFATLLVLSYRDYVNPVHVYGTWIEIGTPAYQTEILTLNEEGVFRNDRLVSTSFKFDGKTIAIETGNGLSLYRVAGTVNTPQLTRLEPTLPMQRFIKQGYEDNLTDSEGTVGQARRAALSEHFSSQ